MTDITSTLPKQLPVKKINPKLTELRDHNDPGDPGAAAKAITVPPGAIKNTMPVGEELHHRLGYTDEAFQNIQAKQAIVLDRKHKEKPGRAWLEVNNASPVAFDVDYFVFRCDPGYNDNNKPQEKEIPWVQGVGSFSVHFAVRKDRSYVLRFNITPINPKPLALDIGIGATTWRVQAKGTPVQKTLDATQNGWVTVSVISEARSSWLLNQVLIQEL